MVSNPFISWEGRPVRLEDTLPFKGILLESAQIERMEKDMGIAPERRIPVEVAVRGPPEGEIPPEVVARARKLLKKEELAYQRRVLIKYERFLKESDGNATSQQQQPRESKKRNRSLDRSSDSSTSRHRRKHSSRRKRYRQRGERSRSSSGSEPRRGRKRDGGGLDLERYLKSQQENAQLLERLAQLEAEHELERARFQHMLTEQDAQEEIARLKERISHVEAQTELELQDRALATSLQEKIAPQAVSAAANQESHIQDASVTQFAVQNMASTTAVLRTAQGTDFDQWKSRQWNSINIATRELHDQLYKVIWDVEMKHLATTSNAQSCQSCWQNEIERNPSIMNNDVFNGTVSLLSEYYTTIEEDLFQAMRHRFLFMNNTLSRIEDSKSTSEVWKAFGDMMHELEQWSAQVEQHVGKLQQEYEIRIEPLLRDRYQIPEDIINFNSDAGWWWLPNYTDSLLQHMGLDLQDACVDSDRYARTMTKIRNDFDIGVLSLDNDIDIHWSMFNYVDRNVGRQRSDSG